MIFIGIEENPIIQEKGKAVIKSQPHTLRCIEGEQEAIIKDFIGGRIDADIEIQAVPVEIDGRPYNVWYDAAHLDSEPATAPAVLVNNMLYFGNVVFTDQERQGLTNEEVLKVLYWHKLNRMEVYAFVNKLTGGKIDTIETTPGDIEAALQVIAGEIMKEV